MFAPILAAGVFDELLRHAGWYAAAAIVVVGLIYGLRDLRNFSLVRAWAISGVCRADAVRRRVLWVTPVAILGVVVVAQFLHPVDPQDAIRQTTKVCLFATGMVVVVTAIILACTNLPKEIDNRVIYTIVTKPTTRLEIVLGKVIGFARVSLLILLIMGLFTWGYLSLRAWRTRGWIREQLAVPGAVDAQLRQAFQLYADTGLLTTKSLAQPKTAQVFGRLPVGDTAVLEGNESQFFVVPFQLTADDKEKLSASLQGGGTVFVVTTLGYEQRIPTKEEAKTIRDMRLPTNSLGGDAQRQNSLLPSLPGLSGISLPIPQIGVHVMDKNLSKLVDDSQVNEGKPLELPPGGGQPRPVGAALSATAVEQIIAAERFSVLVDLSTPTVSYVVGRTPLFVGISFGPGAGAQIPPAPSAADPSVPEAPSFQSHRGRYGMQVRGRSDGSGSVVAYGFRDADVPAADGNVTFELRSGIESGGDVENENNALPRMGVRVHNLDTQKTSPPYEVRIESNRVLPLAVPAEFVRGGNFNVYVNGLNDSTWYGLDLQNLSLVRRTDPFAVNLLKSLLVLWMMSILVVAIAVFTSTFLSWPIAVVLTLVILLGHWGVSQLEDFTGPGLGTEVTSGLGLQDPTAARIVRGSVNFLTGVMTFVAQFLPDISRFPATEDVERGISMPAEKLAGAAAVLFGYGVPVVVLTYMIFRRKEVAP